MKISRDEVARVASLARLSLDESELETYTRQLDQILDYMAQLDTLDTATVEPTAHVLPLTCPLRDDAPRPGLSTGAVLAAAPDSDGEHFVVPPAIEDGGGR